MNKNLYQVLDVKSDASNDEIKKSFRLLASKFHPDKHDGDKFFEEKFKEIKDAYDILSDQIQRKEYDDSFFKQNHHSGEFDHSKSNPSSGNTRTNSTSDYKDFKKNSEADPQKREVSDKRLKGCLIGIVAGAVFAITMSLGDGWWVPIGVLGLIVTIRQGFVVFVTFLKN